MSSERYDTAVVLRAVERRDDRRCSIDLGPIRVRGDAMATDRQQAERQRKARFDAGRPSAAKRGYDSAWHKLRHSFLADHPLCQCDECQGGRGRVRLATVVDHIVPIRDRPDLRLERSNLRAMHKECHDRHTARAQGFAKGGSRKSACGADGRPVDPKHPWNAGGRRQSRSG